MNARKDDGPTGLSTGRLRVGLLAYVLALACDLIDVELADFDDVDVLHDGLALLLYAAAGWGVGQRAAGRVRLVFWLPALACASALVMELSGGHWTYGFFVRLGGFLGSALALVLFALGMTRLVKRAGIQSSARWRRVVYQAVLLVVLPGVLIGFLVSDPRVELPFRHAPGKLDSAWWKETLAWGAVVGATLTCYDAVLASLTSWRSAGRRQ